MYLVTTNSQELFLPVHVSACCASSICIVRNASLLKLFIPKRHVHVCVRVCGQSCLTVVPGEKFQTRKKDREETAEYSEETLVLHSLFSCTYFTFQILHQECFKLRHQLAQGQVVLVWIVCSDVSCTVMMHSCSYN